MPRKRLPRGYRNTSRRFRIGKPAIEGALDS